MNKDDSREVEKESFSSLAQILIAAASVATIADPVKVSLIRIGIIQ